MTRFMLFQVSPRLDMMLSPSRAAQDTMRNLAVVSTLLVYVLASEKFGRIGRLVNQHVPLARKKYRGRTVLAQWILDILGEDVLLIDVLYQGRQCHPEGYRGNAANTF